MPKIYCIEHIVDDLQDLLSPLNEASSMRAGDGGGMMRRLVTVKPITDGRSS